MDFQGFLKDVLGPILDHPDALRVDVAQDGRRCDLNIHAEPEDRGRIIGKNGRMISSLRTLCRATGDKAGLNVNVELIEEEEEA